MEFVYGRLSILHKHAVSILASSAGLLVIIVAMVFLAYFRTRLKGRGKATFVAPAHPIGSLPVAPLSVQPVGK
jgi:hypothetical protein